jgi:hypothetical protein
MFANVYICAGVFYACLYGACKRVSHYNTVVYLSWRAGRLFSIDIPIEQKRKGVQFVSVFCLFLVKMQSTRKKSFKIVD